MSFGSELSRAMRPYPSAGRYLVGVSGGRDSIALLHGLAAMGYCKLVVCHLNHGLRGATSREEAQFVQQLAKRLGFPFETDNADIAALAKQRKLSSETAAREIRYQFFTEVATRRRCRKLLLGHQADDQVETFLFNLLRGTGPAGLAAMAVDSHRTIGRCKLQIIRPLLSVWRTEINEYLRAENLPWREDATNSEHDHATRNRLRLQILPMLKAVMGREIKPALWRTADILGAEEVWITSFLTLEDRLPKQVPLERLISQPLAKQRRLIRAWLLAATVPMIGYREVELVRSLLDKTNGLAKTNLPRGWHARRRGGFLFLEPPAIPS